MKDPTKLSLCIVLLMTLSMSTASCQPWPPGKDNFIAEFSNHRHYFEALLSEFNNTSFSVLEHGGASGGVVGFDSRTGERVPLDDATGSYLQSLLEQARVYRVSRVDGDVVFLRPVGPEIDGRVVRVEFVYRTDGSDIRSCDKFSKSDSGVECEYQLNTYWYLHYFWAKEG